MFGYRVRFLPENMKSYCMSGKPMTNASQMHKPIIYFVQESLIHVKDKYERIEPYNTKQLIVKILDSDDEEQAEEIAQNEKKRKSMPNGANFNPKIKKRYVNLNWHFDENIEDEYFISPRDNKISYSP